MRRRNDSGWSAIKKSFFGYYEQERTWEIEKGFFSRFFKVTLTSNTSDAVNGVDWEISVDGWTLRRGHSKSFAKARSSST
jgi:hypothetical protein